MVRYTMSVPDAVMERLRIQAKKEGHSVKDVILQFVQLGFLSVEIEEDKNQKLIVEKHGVQTQLKVIW